MTGDGPHRITRVGVLWLVSVAGLSVVGLSNTSGPPAGYTGGFSEPTCRSCHMDLPLNEPGGVLEVRGLEGELKAGSTRLVTLTLRGGGMERAGFQAAFRVYIGEPRGAPAGKARPIDDRTRVVRSASNGVEYVQHTELGSELVEGEGRWAFEWTPPERAGVVAFHVAANSANGDDSPLGDLIYTKMVEVRIR